MRLIFLNLIFIHLTYCYTYVNIRILNYSLPHIIINFKINDNILNMRFSINLNVPFHLQTLKLYFHQVTKIQKWFNVVEYKIK